MRFRTLEIRWHDSKPISTCDFQPLPFKRARPPPGSDERFSGHSYRLATGGEDNHVRIWMVHPNIRPTSLVKDDPNPAAPRPPRIEYLSTLSRHSAAVNVVRFSPNVKLEEIGELIASAGDDGMIIVWAQSANPHAAAYGSDVPPDEAQLDREFWKPRTTFRCTTMQVYDLAWSPTGEYIIAGSTDNTARVFASADGKCVCEIAEHSHFVQGVAWDPLNEYIATQSSDRSMHVYRISTKNGAFEAHAIGRNTRMPHRHTRTPSAHGSATATTPSTRPKMFRRESTASDAESSSAVDKDDVAPLTPATSVASTPSLAMFPPPPIIDKGGPSSRRSSFSASSNAPGSPYSSVRYGRSPSPMPPLPAIRSLPASAQAQWANVKLYGDESYTNFFRRLTFSPDGGLLLTPAGQFEDPIIIPSSLSHKAPGSKEEGGATTPSRGRKGRPSVVTDTAATASTSAAGGNASASASTSSVFIYSRANFARPPIAQLPGHRKASVAVRFSPILYELRPNVESGEAETKTKTAALEKGMEGTLDVDVTGPAAGVQVVISPAPGSGPGSGSVSDTPTSTSTSLTSPQRTPVQSTSQSQSQSQGSQGSTAIASPLPRLALSTTQLEGQNSALMLPSPGLSPMDLLRPPTPAASKPSTPAVHAQAQAQTQAQVHGLGHSGYVQTQVPGSGATGGASTASVFALPYRMLYAVVTMDAVAIYDTQQAGPVCLLTKLHYDEFTDMTWSSDGQTLLLSSRDGYCTIVIFDEILAASHLQQHALQLQSIAHQNSVPLVSSSSATNTPATSTINLPHLHTAHTHVLGTPSNASSKKRSEQPLTPAASTDGDRDAASYFGVRPVASGGSTLPGTPIMTATAVSLTASGSGGGGNASKPLKRQAPGSGTGATPDSSGPSSLIADGDGSHSNSNSSGSGSGGNNNDAEEQLPPKKKRRVALTRVGDLDL
ncbi:WD40 repeat-like protein [Macrolepiota fuliginosa MF-IS2]|uniref:WD40 repeat-like protein n=1 Tax=Macrolepiota fuliginosa MF-IS2 TaxID=1400762 RepID=A0A9P5XMU1_9AGAR|nr:WD40 repeat-like protein [Macrolepiota fuliginosa MF-IS2]